MAQTNFIWRTYDGREIPLAEIEDTHLANIIRWVYERLDRYPPAVLDVMVDEAYRRKLPVEFLGCAEIPWKDTDGDWCLDCRKLPVHQ